MFKTKNLFRLFMTANSLIVLYSTKEFFIDISKIMKFFQKK